MGVKSTNITAVQHRVPKEARWRANRHMGGVLWFTGLSGAGKSTLAFELEHLLFDKGYQAYVLDGDNVRHGLCSDLGFSPHDRSENIRRIGETASLFAEAGFIVLSAFISPYREDRLVARTAAGENFNEIYLSADVSDCEKRDPKGLYQKARRGEIPEFTGISAPYEAPIDPELVIDTGKLEVQESLEILLRYIEQRFAMPE
ncbi:MAG: adenylyl-sulfate kinase [Hyphomicrobiales bacterium]|nr:adenylyl-sulfate kinase [Hyphomicrobiales bacterium]